MKHLIFFILLFLCCNQSQNIELKYSPNKEYSSKKFINKDGGIDSIIYLYNNMPYITDYNNKNFSIIKNDIVFKNIDEKPEIIIKVGNNSHQKEVVIKFKYTHITLCEVKVEKGIKVDSFKSNKITNSFYIKVSSNQFSNNFITVSPLGACINDSGACATKANDIKI